MAPGGVIAHGTADGHQWRLAVQDIADPGYSCLPAITINGTDADPVYPRSDTAAVVALGSALPGVGFAFVQLPADITGIVVNGDVSVPAVTVAACGLRYHVAGFAYSLARPLRVTVANPPPGWPLGLHDATGQHPAARPAHDPGVGRPVDQHELGAGRDRLIRPGLRNPPG